MCCSLVPFIYFLAPNASLIIDAVDTVFILSAHHAANGFLRSNKLICDGQGFTQLSQFAVDIFDCIT